MSKKKIQIFNFLIFDGLSPLTVDIELVYLSKVSNKCSVRVKRGVSNDLAETKYFFYQTKTRLQIFTICLVKLDSTSVTKTCIVNRQSSMLCEWLFV